MANVELLAKRANSDQQKLITITLPIIDHTSSALREHLQHSLTHKKFNTQKFVHTNLYSPLTSLMIASHCAGAKFSTDLAKASNKDIEASLELSILSSAIKFAQRMKENFQELKKRYSSSAFGVIQDASKNVNEELLGTVQELIAKGAHVKEAKATLAAKFDSLGLRPASKGQFETIFRTQGQIAFAAGKYEAETKNDFIYRELWGYKYVTVEDSRTRPTHEALDGTCLPKDHPFWQIFYPPNGFNCRCQAIPLFTEHEIKTPPKFFNGQPLKPDKGFDWKAGTVFNALAS